MARSSSADIALILCTSGFMDEVMYDHNVPYGVAWPACSASSHQLRLRPGWSLLSMDACLLLQSEDIICKYLLK